MPLVRLHGRWLEHRVPDFNNMNTKKILGFFLFLFFSIPHLALASTFESQTGSFIDDWATLAIGSTFVAQSTHTITAIDIYQHAGTTATVIVHITTATTTANTGLPTATDIAVSANFTTSAGVNNVPIPCTNLTSGTAYGFWIQYVSGTYDMDALALNSFHNLARSSSNTGTLPTIVNTTEATPFTIYGNSGTCKSFQLWPLSLF